MESPRVAVQLPRARLASGSGLTGWVTDGPVVLRALDSKLSCPRLRDLVSSGQMIDSRNAVLFR